MSDAPLRRRARSAAARPAPGRRGGGGRVCHGRPRAERRRSSAKPRSSRLNVIAGALDPRREAGPRSHGARPGTSGGPDGHDRAVGGRVVRRRPAARDEPEAAIARPASFLLFLIPVLGAAREEYRGHFPGEDRREIAIDATLIAASLAAICYAIIRPSAAGADRVAVRRDVRDRGGHALRGVRRPDALDPVARAPRPVARASRPSPRAIVVFGWGWTRGSFHVGFPGIVIVFMVAGPVLAAAMVVLPRRADIGSPTSGG